MRPILFEIFGVPIPSFGFMFALAVIVGIWVTLDGIARAGGDTDKTLTVLMVAVCAGYIGARAWWMVEAVARGTATDVSLSGLFWNSGFTWYGGFAVGLVAGLGAARVAGVGLVMLTEAWAPGLAIAQAIGRIGCFLVGDDYGKATTSWVGIAFPEGSPPVMVPVHPTMLYEMVWLFLVGAWLWRRRGRSPSVFGEYLILAGCGRFVIEFLRLNPRIVGPLTSAQVVALVSIAAGAAWLRYRSGKGNLESTGPVQGLDSP